MNKTNVSNAWQWLAARAWWTMPASLSLLTFLIYCKTFWYGFVFDDFPTIIQYYHIRFIDWKGQVFCNPRWLSRLFNQITYHFWQSNPVAYRLPNLLIHLAIGVMIFALLYRLLSKISTHPLLAKHAFTFATLASMLYLLHPVQTQTVTYITQMRLEGLVAFFITAVMTTFVFAITASNSKQRRILLGCSFALTAFAAGTKEIAIVLPPLLVLFDWFLVAQGDWGSFKPRIWIHIVYSITLYGIMFKYGLLNTDYIRTIASVPVRNNRGNILTQNFHENISWYPFLLSQAKVLLHYLTIFFWPFNICFDYDVKLSQHAYDLDVLAPLGLFAFLAIICVRMYKNSVTHPVIFGLLWFFVSMLPRTSIFPTTELICDYKTYPASFGIMIILAFGMVYLLEYVTEFLRTYAHPIKTIAHNGSIGLLCMLLTWATYSRNHVWSSELEFWGDVLKKAPKARAFNNYGIALWELKQVAQAKEYFNKSIEKDDWYAEPHINLATIYQIENDNNKALDHYKRALEIGEAHPELFNNLGMLHFANKSWDQAEYCLKQAIELKPAYSKPYANLAKVYQIQGKTELALQLYQQAIRADNPDAETFYLYASLCMEKNQPKQAIELLQSLKTEFLDSTFLLGCCYYSTNDYQTAVAYFEKAYQKDPSNKSVWYNYAQALLNTKNYEKALALYSQCLGDIATFPYAPIHTVKCLHGLGKMDEAKKLLHDVFASNLPNDIKREARQIQKDYKLA